MKLTKLFLKNFKGLRDKTIKAPGGCSLNIYGDNGTGKTSLADAITFILFDKDTMGRSPANFGIKTREDGDVIHNLQHEVEAHFIEPDLKLKKVYKEKWTRSRGDAEKNLTGHTTDYYIDDDEVKKKDYEAAISEVMTDEQFKILTVPSYFAEEMHWSDRRKVLAEIAGEIDDQSVIDMSPESEIEEYQDILDGKSPELRKTNLTKRRSKLIESIDQIPQRIDENMRSIKDVDASMVESEIEELNRKKEMLTDKLSKARSGGGVADLQVMIEDVESKRQQMVSDYHEEMEEKIESKRSDYRQAQNKYDATNRELREYKSKIDEAENALDVEEILVNNIKESIANVEGREPRDKPEQTEGGLCPYCEQPMDSDHNFKEELKEYEEYMAEFNEDKADELKSLAEDLESANRVIEERKRALEKARNEHSEAKERDGYAKRNLDEARDELDKAKQSLSDVKDTDDYKDLIARKEKIDEKIKKIRSDKKGTIESIQDEIADVDNLIKEFEEKKFQEKRNDEIRDRIKELKGELKQAQLDLEEVEHSLFVLQQFELNKAKMITSRVNGMFDIVSWKMFERQMNGAINDQMCEPVVGGIPYSDGLNNAMRIQAGLDIINTIGKYLGKTAPVIIDNAESIVGVNAYDLQVIALYVSEKDKQLRIEEKS